MVRVRIYMYTVKGSGDWRDFRLSMIHVLITGERKGLNIDACLADVYTVTTCTYKNSLPVDFFFYSSQLAFLYFPH